MNTANQISNNQTGAGNARASGYIGSANALTGAIGQGYNMYQGNQMLNLLQNRGGNNPADEWANNNAMSGGITYPTGGFNNGN